MNCSNFAINATVGLIGVIFAFLYYLWGIVVAYQASMLSGLAFFAVAALAGLSVAATCVHRFVPRCCCSTHSVHLVLVRVHCASYNHADIVLLCLFFCTYRYIFVIYGTIIGGGYFVVRAALNAQIENQRAGGVRRPITYGQRPHYE